MGMGCECYYYPTAWKAGWRFFVLLEISLKQYNENMYTKSLSGTGMGGLDESRGSGLDVRCGHIQDEYCELATRGSEYKSNSC
jgi:hypothetical protein